MKHLLMNTENLPAEKFFLQVADKLLNNSVLCVARKKLRFIEIEFYFYSKEHLDIFTHRDTWQQKNSYWYFHRIGSNYRDGTYKGLDITFGQGDNYGGILIRSLQNENGDIFEGPCVCVNYLMELTKQSKLYCLANRAEETSIFSQENLLYIEEQSQPLETIYSTGRIGLSLKRADHFTDRTHYILKPYRYCIFPQKLKKGKVYTILGLHRNKFSIPQIAELTNSNTKNIQNYINLFESGKTHNDFSQYKGVALNNSNLAKLHGTWQTLVEDKK